MVHEWSLANRMKKNKICKVFDTVLLILLCLTVLVPANRANAGTIETNTYESYTEMIAGVRDALVNREEEVKVSYTDTRLWTDKEIEESYLSELLNCCYASYSGMEPMEGDYLRYHVRGGTANVSIKTIQEGEYEYDVKLDLEYLTNRAQENYVDDVLADRTTENSWLRTPEGVIFDINTATALQKIEFVQRYIVSHVQYEDRTSEQYTKYSAYDALYSENEGEKPQAVCQGFATLAYRMLAELGVPVRVITGSSYGENHAWNIVEIEGSWYNMDTTWDTVASTQNSDSTTWENYLHCDADFLNHQANAEFLTEEFAERYPMSMTCYQGCSRRTLLTIEDGAEVTNQLEGLGLTAIDGTVLTKEVLQDKYSILCFYSGGSQIAVLNELKKLAESGVPQAEDVEVYAMNMRGTGYGSSNADTIQQNLQLQKEYGLKGFHMVYEDFLNGNTTSNTMQFFVRMLHLIYPEELPSSVTPPFITIIRPDLTLDVYMEGDCNTESLKYYLTDCAHTENEVSWSDSPIVLDAERGVPRIKWNGMGYGTKYTVYRSRYEKSGYIAVGVVYEEENQDTLQFVDKSVLGENTYFYRVRAEGYDFLTDYSSPQSILMTARNTNPENNPEPEEPDFIDSYPTQIVEDKGEEVPNQNLPDSPSTNNNSANVITVNKDVSGTSTTVSNTTTDENLPSVTTQSTITTTVKATTKTVVFKKPKLKKAMVKKKKLYLTWKKLGKVSGIEFFVKIGKGKYKKFKTYKGYKKVKATFTKLAGKRFKKKTRYQIRMRAYRIVNGKRSVSAYSNVLKFSC